MRHGLYPVLGLLACALAALLVDGSVQAAEITATIHMNDGDMTAWVKRACEWFHLECGNKSIEEQAQQIAEHFHGVVTIRPDETMP